MPAHLFREIENLKKEILTLGAMAESAVREAVAAIDNRDEDAAAGGHCQRYQAR